MKAIFYPCACFCTVATKSVLAFLQKLPDTTENFQRLENLFENRKLSKNNTASSKNYCITANSAKNTAFNCKIRKNTALLQIFTKIQHHCKLPQKHLTAKCNKKLPERTVFCEYKAFFCATTLQRLRLGFYNQRLIHVLGERVSNSG